MGAEGPARLFEFCAAAAVGSGAVEVVAAFATIMALKTSKSFLRSLVERLVKNTLRTLSG